MTADLRRRPLKTRGKPWAQSLAAWLTRAGIEPNHISLFGLVAAAGGATAFIAAGRTAGSWPRAACFLLAGGCVQLRLLCNLMDGLVAVEGGRRTPSGEIYNEAPDRVADILFLAAAGHSTGWTGWEPEFGWAAATMAVLVAYIRALGGQAGASQYFLGPMAKPHRMFALTVACAASAAEALARLPARMMTLALGIIIVGAIWTAVRRTVCIMAELERKPAGR